MRASILVCVLACGVLLAADAPKKPVSEGAVARLIAQLGSPDHATREDATRTLLELGEPALDALRKARTAPDAEVRRRASLLVRRIEQRLETENILAPSRVRLVLKDTPLPDAVEQLARKANGRIELKGEREELAKKKVTLDTGEVGFWQALDQLCRKAGLVEAAPPPPPAPKGRGGFTGTSIVVIGGGGGGRPMSRDLLKQAEEEIRPLLLAEGKPAEMPASMTSSVRVRVLPAGEKLPGKPRGEDEYLVGLEVKAEPRMAWRGTVGLRLAKAVDDQGQSLLDRTTLPGPEIDPNRNSGTIVINQVPLTPSRGPDIGTTGPLPLRLKKGEKPAKKLVEVSGTLVGMIHSAAETLVTVDDVLKAAGKTVKGPKAGWVKVMQVSRDEGEIKLRVQVEVPELSLDDNTQVQTAATVIINGEVQGQKKVGLHANSFSLLDAQGKPLPIVKSSDTGVRAGTAREVELVFRAGKEDGTPAKLLFRGRRAALVEVPFTLKDVPLMAP